MIDGQPDGVAGRVPGDWTDGRIAVSSAGIKALRQAAPDGTAIGSVP